MPKISAASDWLSFARAITASSKGRSTVRITISYKLVGTCSPRSRNYLSRLFLITSGLLSLLIMLPRPDYSLLLLCRPAFLQPACSLPRHTAVALPASAAHQAPPAPLPVAPHSFPVDSYAGGT